MKRTKIINSVAVEILYRQGTDVPANATEVIIDSSVTVIPDFCFRECHKLELVRLNQGLLKIGKGAFLGCRSLRAIEIPLSVTDVGIGAFQDCKYLRHVILKSGLTKIKRLTFCECASLERVEIPSSVTEVGMCAFKGCSNLMYVILNLGLKKIEQDAFYFCRSLGSIDIPSSVIEIGPCVFRDCRLLREVKLHEGLQKIGPMAFLNDRWLKSIEIPSSVNVLGISAFGRCTRLRQVSSNVNVGLHNIHSDAFDGCESLEVVKFPKITNRMRSLIDVGQTQVVDKVALNPSFQWSGLELLLPLEELSVENLEVTKEYFGQILDSVSYYELRFATAAIEIAFWRTDIKNEGALTIEARDACRREVPGPVKDAILQYIGNVVQLST